MSRLKDLKDFKAIVIDCNYAGKTKFENDIKNDFIVPVDHQVGTYKDLIKGTVDDNSKLLISQVFKPSDIKEIKNLSNLPVVIKGILTPESAIEALDNGADAIWVSNNGGRILDTIPSTISVLKSIVKAVRSHRTNSKVEVFVDGGVRRGTDVLKCMAYGA